MLKWAIELSEYKIKYQPRLALKGQAMANFIAKLPLKPSHLTNSPKEGWWVLYVDEAYKASGSGVGLILQSPTRELLEQAIWLGFSVSNNEIECKAILA